MLCNDREVLGPWANKTWLNIVAAIIVAVLVELSLILVVTTVFPSVDAAKLFLYMSIALLAALAASGAYIATHRVRVRDPFADLSPEARRSWTMPPLALLERPPWSPGRRAGMLLLRGYLVVAVVLLIVKTVQLGH
jgi:hypothetical protein